MNKAINIRTVACQVVHDIAHQQQSLSRALPVASELVAAKDKALLQELVYGTCRWYYQLEGLHQQFLSRPLNRNDNMATTLLSVGAYQLLHTRIPVHAAINETVAAAEELELKHLKGLINAVLRKISSLKPSNETSAAIASHPEWMREKIRHNWPEHWQSILLQNNLHPPMTLRINSSAISKSQYLQKLESAGIEARSAALAPYAISLARPQQVSSLPGFSSGQVSVQDEAAQLCCQLMDLRPGHRVLDACAAPGGKTCAMLESVPDINLLALDIDHSRTKLISDNLTRLNLSAQIQTAAAEQTDKWWDKQPFDRILLDAPCSATGVIRRNPDIKLLRRPDDIKKLAELQLKLLSSLWLTLNEGGKLLYATCSVFPQENSRVIERFLKQESSAQLVPLEVEWGIDSGFGRQLFPQQNGHDGFFYACLTKH
jgi:16S rRNA (cytosine967-C5)-methyltransferase